MVHLPALPGTPRGAMGVEEISSIAVDEAKKLEDAGFEGVIVENMHDAPYVHGGHGPEIVAAMTAAARAVWTACAGLRFLGVQVLSGGNREAVAIASSAGGVDGARMFVRCENFVFAHVADEGILERAEAGELLRYRRAIGADGSLSTTPRVDVYCDLKKKHASHAITADVPIDEAARAAEFFGADGVIVTGVATGRSTSIDDVRLVREATDLPVLVGSGVTPDDGPRLLAHADALIVGSWIKESGHWSRPVDPARARELVRVCRA